MMTKLECEEYLVSLGITRNLKEDYFNWFHRLSKREVMDWKKDMDYTLTEIKARNLFIEKYGFAILCREAIEAIRPYAPILEIGSGTGYWTLELQEHGIDCVATDPKTGKYVMGTDYKGKIWDTFYTYVDTLDCYEAIPKYPDRNLLIVWPDYDNPWAYHALRMFTGQTVIYMGEGYGNATADDQFHEYLDEVFTVQSFVRMPHFWGSYDRFMVIASRPKLLL